MEFTDISEKCPWKTLTISMLTICSANDKICKEENCGIAYWTKEILKFYGRNN